MSMPAYLKMTYLKDVGDILSAQKDEATCYRLDKGVADYPQGGLISAADNFKGRSQREKHIYQYKLQINCCLKKIAEMVASPINLTIYTVPTRGPR